VIAEMLASRRRPPTAAALVGGDHRHVRAEPHPQAAAAAVRASEEFAGYLRELIAARRTDLGEDLISALIAARDDGDVLSEQEMVSTIVLLLNAGHEATVNTTTVGWLTPVPPPGQLRMLSEDPGGCGTGWRRCCATTPRCRCSSAGCWTTSR